MSEHDFPKKPAEQSNRCDNPMGRQDGTEGAAPSKSGREGVKAELERRQGWAEYGAARNRGENPTHPGVASVLAQRAVAIRAAAERVMRKPGDSKQSAATQIPKSGGSPLAPNVKTQMEQQLGADLSEVKIHTGTDSARAAEQLGARAMTVGSDVHFAAGQFAPETKEGTRLLTHELTHVVQGQKSGVQRKAEPGDGERKVEARGTPGAAPAEGGDAKGEAHSDDSGKATGEHTEVSQPGEPAEQEADKIADDVTKKLHGGDEKRRGNKADENGEKADAKEKGGGKRVGSSGGAASPEGEGSSVGAANEGEGGEAEAQGPEAPKSQAGPNGVKARAEAAHAEGMSAGHAAAEKKPAQIRAQLEGVGLKVWRTATTRGCGSPRTTWSACSGA